VFAGQGTKCLKVAILPGGTSAKSGFRPGIEKERVLARHHIPESKGNDFQVDYTTSHEKALWLSEKSRPKDGKGWVAMCGVCVGFQKGRLRSVVLYTGLSD
jgi:hypothetical protein